MTDPLDRLRSDARAIFDAAVEAVQAPALIEAHADWIEEALAGRDTAHVVGVGKAAMAMGGALEARFPDLGFQGELTVPHGYPDAYPTSLPRPTFLRVGTAGHPVPDVASAAAGHKALARAQSLDETDLLIVLLSGGGSALWTTPWSHLELANLEATTRLLLESGVPIEGINEVRKRLSAVAGGRLAAAAHPARVLALVISDVVGDDLTAIASGPTVGDPRSGDRLAIRTRPLWMRIPGPVRTALEDPANAPLAPDDRHLERAQTHLIGSNRVALAAARAAAEALGYRAEIASSTMDGEAREIGGTHAQELVDGSPRVVLWGGETTVTVTGNGRGGRNQEVALAAALELASSERPAVLLCGGTDGIDGPTDAAGGIVTPQTVARGHHLGLRAGDYLDRNDAYSFLSAVGGLVITGPTHTNVMDLHVGLVG